MGLSILCCIVTSKTRIESWNLGTFRNYTNNIIHDLVVKFINIHDLFWNNFEVEPWHFK